MKSKLKWKASLINKRSRVAVVVSLTEEDVEFLVTNTSYSIQEISEWHKQFLDQCPQVGRLILMSNQNYEPNFLFHMSSGILSSQK